MKYHYKAGVVVPFVQQHYKLLVLAVAGLFVASISAMSLMASAAVTTWDQGFEVDASGWRDTDDGWHGSINQVASGNDGITSADGSFHAVVEGNGISAPTSNFDMRRNVWPGTWTASVDVYLDTAWNDGEGFDYSVASNGSDGNHQRDFIFHVTKDTSTGDLLVAGSNNTNFSPREDLETINNYPVTSSGWYTLQHVFRDDTGVLAVDLNLLDSAGVVLFTETRSAPADTIPGEVGGNRYAWFTVVDVADGIAIDKHTLVLNDQAYPTTGEITSPNNGEVVSGQVTLSAIYDDGDDINDDAVQWAVRTGATCQAGGNNVAGNVGTFNDPYDWNGANFEAIFDSTSVEDGVYCFVFNPADDSGENNVREVVSFEVDNRADNKEECKNGGWAMGLSVAGNEFKNQGHCVSHFASNGTSTNARNR